jgi:hypothetical protein
MSSSTGVREQTLQLSRPPRSFGVTWMMTALLLGFILAIGEIVVRQTEVRARLTTPALGSSNRHLARQWHRLEALTNSGVPIDCIVLGNSMVLNGLNPLVFNRSYQQETGEDVHCFNFGVDALTPVPASVLAEILVERYQPRLLVFGTDARDFAVAPDSEETSFFMDLPWLQYQMGNFNLEGWLVEHFYLFRYRHHLRSLMRFDSADWIRNGPEPIENQYGFEPYDIIAAITTPPDRNDDSYHVQYYFGILGNYIFRPENQAALAEILAQDRNGLAVVVVEMPVPDTYFDFFDRPETDYAEFIGGVRAVTARNGVLFIESTRYHLIPDDGWMDYSHVNTRGATLFSEWLGRQIGRAAVEGQIAGLTAE